MGDKTPEEAFIGEKAEVGHLRIFGCLVYIHVPKEKRTKMEPSGKKGTFVGYSEIAKAYHIYVLGQRYIEVNRDVTFRKPFDNPESLTQLLTWRSMRLPLQRFQYLILPMQRFRGRSLMST